MQKVDGITDEHFTAIDVYRRTIRLAECLQYKYNIKSGDVVSISSENRIEFALIAFATISLGATLAPLNTTYTESKSKFEKLTLFQCYGRFMV